MTVYITCINLAKSTNLDSWYRSAYILVKEPIKAAHYSVNYMISREDLDVVVLLTAVPMYNEVIGISLHIQIERNV